MTLQEYANLHPDEKDLPPVKHPETGEKYYLFSQWISGSWLSKEPRDASPNQELFPVFVTPYALEVYEE